MPKLRYGIRFMREELNHVVMTMDITEADMELVMTLTEEELTSWIYDKSMSVSYAPGNEDTLIYEWETGKEYCEGEGERGIWDFALETWTQHGGHETRTESTPLGRVEPVTEVDRDPAFTVKVDPTLEIAERVDRAAAALHDYDNVRDLLADLKHYCDANAIEFPVEEMRAHDHYLAEVSEAAVKESSDFIDSFGGAK